jgi:hypothetical protein
MVAVTFDTLKFVKTLEASGVASPQAEAFAAAVRDSSESADLVTRKDLQIELAPIRADITLVKWMLGAVVAGVLALVMKAFLHL